MRAVDSFDDPRVAKLIEQFRTMDERAKRSLCVMAETSAEKYPAHRKPVLTLVRGAPWQQVASK